VVCDQLETAAFKKEAEMPYCRESALELLVKSGIFDGWVTISEKKRPVVSRNGLPGAGGPPLRAYPTHQPPATTLNLEPDAT